MQLVHRTLATLRELGDGRPRGMQELGLALGIPLPSMHRLLSTMEADGFVMRRPDRQYVLGPEALVLAAGPRPLEQECRPYMEHLAASTGATVFLTELIGDKAICTGLIQGSGALRLFVHVGQSLPLHAAAASRTLLAQLPEAAVRGLLRERTLERFTPDTPATVDDVLDRCAAARERGYDVCSNELDPGVVALSAPIVRPHAGPASLTVAAPESKAAGHADRWAGLLIDVTGRMSGRANASGESVSHPT